MTSRRDIEFPAEDGTVLRGWLYEPEGGGPSPTVVMAHGFSAVKEMYLDDFAAAFADAGLAALVYDHRNLGASDGTPRGDIDPHQQIDDYRTAITYATTLDAVDGDRIGVWGSSYSGAHVLVVAAVDRRVKCVVSQVPLVAGLETARRLVRGDHFAGLRAAFDGDRAARFGGAEPAMIPVTWEDDPAEPCALPTADSHDFFFGPITSRAPSWKKEVTLRSVERFVEYEPQTYVPMISPTPLLLVVAEGDHLVPADLALRAYASALEPKKLLVLPGGHFEAYVDANFATSIEVQREWFRTHLRGK